MSRQHVHSAHPASNNTPLLSTLLARFTPQTPCRRIRVFARRGSFGIGLKLYVHSQRSPPFPARAFTSHSASLTRFQMAEAKIPLRAGGGNVRRQGGTPGRSTGHAACCYSPLATSGTDLNMHSTCSKLNNTPPISPSRFDQPCLIPTTPPYRTGQTQLHPPWRKHSAATTMRSTNRYLKAKKK